MWSFRKKTIRNVPLPLCRRGYISRHHYSLLIQKKRVSVFNTLCFTSPPPPPRKKEENGCLKSTVRFMLSERTDPPFLLLSRLFRVNNAYHRFLGGIKIFISFFFLEDVFQLLSLILVICQW